MYFVIIGLITVTSGTAGGCANCSLQAIFLLVVDFTRFVFFVVILGFVVVVAIAGGREGSVVTVTVGDVLMYGSPI